MTNVKDIEKAISNLPLEELEKFRAWYEKFDADQWDLQFEKDAENGSLDHIANEALRDYKKGNFKKL
ncbi:MAG: hypothetical protein JW731_04635 [Bacteroidales bacterium]|nr:hypothetical protein [Bacteroidales bacterium]